MCSCQGQKAGKGSIPLLRTSTRRLYQAKNVLDEDMREAVLQLEKLGDETRQSFKQDYRHESWFQEWDAMVEASAATEAANEDDNCSGTILRT